MSAPGPVTVTDDPRLGSIITQYNTLHQFLTNYINNQQKHHVVITGFPYDEVTI